MKKKLMTLGLILALALSLMVLGGQSVSACDEGCKSSSTLLPVVNTTSIPYYSSATVAQPVTVPLNQPMIVNGQSAYSQMTVPVYISQSSTMTTPVLVSTPAFTTPYYACNTVYQPCSSLIVNSTYTSCSTPCYRPCKKSCFTPWYNSCSTPWYKSCSRPTYYTTVDGKLVTSSELDDALYLPSWGWGGYSGIIIR